MNTPTQYVITIEYSTDPAYHPISVILHKCEEGLIADLIAEFHGTRLAPLLGKANVAIVQEQTLRTQGVTR